MVLHHWFGLLGPARLPKPIVVALHDQVTAAIAQPAIVERYKSLMLEAATNTPEEFRALIEADLARWSKVVKDAGITAQ
jgi:tripartite-type tricarboxylate transporter receptor subunit TctC